MRYVEARAGLLGLLANLTVGLSFVPVLRGPDVTNQSSGCRCGPARTKVCTRRSGSAGQSPTERNKNAKAAATQESEVFDWLAANAGIRTKMVSLGVTSGGYRGLVANEDVEEGQVCSHALLLYRIYVDRTAVGGTR